METATIAIVPTIRPGVRSTRPSSSVPHRIGRAVVSVRRSTSTWLRRPLTSLHLLLAVFGLLTAFGLVMVLSASNAEAAAQGSSPYAVFVRQAAFCGVGIVLFWIGLRVPLRRLRAAGPVLLLISLVLLIAVLIPGLVRQPHLVIFGVAA
ncbi:FtsW/RodA/SpoVE family cell cycle protein [Pseudonocardia sp.]|uniref:FtsW/RodA/SpoVE family cell cycle protein n=1 Tax=Pseudonocardia sp. TaxID=60912 RepID=UPI0025D66C37|nr:FtsW/RodA/SpoVE family cell cycle protein [Pseudonocardia sp.]